MAQHSSKGARLQAITANRLSDGEVVYFTPENNWQTDFQSACVFDGPEAIEAQLASLATQQTELEVVGVYAFEVEKINDAHKPVSVRETIRAAGPTIRKDLGKQAQA